LSVTLYANSYTILQRFALKAEPVKFLKGLQSNPFKNFTVVLLIGNCCKTKKRVTALGAVTLFLV
jgi:hypothetical protein